MPCYCDIPNEADQKEIESRCKLKMYWNAFPLLTVDQIKKCEKGKLSYFPNSNIDKDLCKLCKILTKEQMELVTAFYFQIKWKHKTLYDWHLKHCEDDKKFNEK